MQEKLIESMNALQEAVSILKIEPGMQNILEERVKALAIEIEWPCGWNLRKKKPATENTDFVRGDSRILDQSHNLLQLK